MHTTEINPIVQSQWRCLARHLKDVSEDSRVTVSLNSEGEFVCKSRSTPLDLIPNFLSWMVPDQYYRDNRATIQYLFDWFGRERMVRVCTRIGFDINYNYEHGHSLSKRYIQEIFVQLGSVYKEDLIQIFREIKEADEGYLHLSKEDVEGLQERFRGREFSSLDKADIDELYKIAIPFTNIETIFLNDPPKDLRSGMNKGGDFWETRKVVYFSEWIRRNSPVKEGSAHLCDYYVLKQLLGPKTPHQLVIPDGRGYRYVWRKEADDGMMQAVFLQTLTQGQGESFNSQIAFLPTQFFSDAPRKWAGWLEDLRSCMGSEAIIKKFDEWTELLLPKKKGFLRREDQKVDVIGYSLGGVQAQRLAAALSPLGIVKKLTVVCSPGIDYHTANWFRTNHSRFKELPHIFVVRNLGDVVSDLGDEVLGSGCRGYRGTLSCEYLVPKRQVKEDMSIETILSERAKVVVPKFSAMTEIVQSLFWAHRDELLYAGAMLYGTSSQIGSEGLCEPNPLLNRTLGYESLREVFAIEGKRRFVKFLKEKYPNLETA